MYNCVPQAGGTVPSLTLCSQLLQVFQGDVFVPRAVRQAVIDHGVLGNTYQVRVRGSFVFARFLTKA